MANKDKYNRKVIFSLFLILFIAGLFLIINLVLQHEHFFLSLFIFLVTVYVYKILYKLLSLFLHGVPTKSFEILLLETFNVNNNTTNKYILSKNLDRLIYKKLNILIEKQELYYIYDYATAIKNICDNYFYQQRENKKIPINLILTSLKQINEISKKLPIE